MLAALSAWLVLTAAIKANLTQTQWVTNAGTWSSEISYNEQPLMNFPESGVAGGSERRETGKNTDKTLFPPGNVNVALTGIWSFPDQLAT